MMNLKVVSAFALALTMSLPAMAQTTGSCLKTAQGENPSEKSQLASAENPSQKNSQLAAAENPSQKTSLAAAENPSQKAQLAAAAPPDKVSQQAALMSATVAPAHAGAPISGGSANPCP